MPAQADILSRRANQVSAGGYALSSGIDQMPRPNDAVPTGADDLSDGGYAVPA
jgi:hypothetical protein